MADPKLKSDDFFTSSYDGLKMQSTEQTPTSSSEKIEVLKRYPLVFKEIDVTLTNILPILMHRKEAHLLMERIYDRQHELLLKRKTLEAINIPVVIRTMVSEQNNQTRQHFIQTISNLLYSGEKYSTKHPEFLLFLRFCQANFDPYQILYYLFIRQHFKVITYTSFIAHKKSGIDPDQILLSKENAGEIVRTAFSHDTVTQTLLKDEVSRIYKEKPKATYYDFIRRMNDVKLNYKDLQILDKLLALYSVDYEEQLRRHFEQKSKSPKVRVGKGADGALERPARDSIDKAVFGSKEGTENIVRSPVRNEPDPLDIQEADPGKNALSTVESRPAEIKDRQKAQPVQKKKLVVARVEPENFYWAVRSQIAPAINNLLMSAPVSKTFNLNQIQENSSAIGVLIDNKLASLVDAIFGEDQKKFARLLRDEHNLNSDISKFWEKVQAAIHKEGIEENFTDDDSVAVLKDLLAVQVVADHVKFLIGYRFKSSQELSELQAKERELLERV